MVGGAVRDYMLNKPAKDIDFTTNLSPEGIKEVASSNGWKIYDPNSAKYGMIGVIVDGESYEITTMRSDHYHPDDTRRPQSVSYVDSLEEDLKRRDFTINAMAMDENGNITDGFNGEQDLENGIVRAVGDPYARMKEDNLRAFRAARFAAQLGFELDPELKEAMSSSEVHNGIQNISLERVKGEIDKILEAPYPSKGINALVDTGLADCTCKVTEYHETKQVSIMPEISRLKGVEQSEKYHYTDVLGHTLDTLDNTPSDLDTRYAALFHDVAKGLDGVRSTNKEGDVADYGHDEKGAEIAREVMERWGHDKDSTKQICRMIEGHMVVPAKEKSWNKKIRKDLDTGIFKNKEDYIDFMDKQFSLFRADSEASKVANDGIEDSKALFKKAVDKPLFRHELDIDGNTIKEKMGLSKESVEVGNTFDYLLQRCRDQGLENKREVLVDAIESKVARNNKEEVVEELLDNSGAKERKGLV